MRKIDMPERPVLNLDPGKGGTQVQMSDGIKCFERDKEGGVVVTVEGYIGGGGGYPYVTLRSKEKLHDWEFGELAEQIRLKPFGLR